MKITYATEHEAVTEEHSDRMFFHIYINKENMPCGYMTCSWQIGKETVAFLKSPYGIPIREAWLEARRVAEENNIEEIVVFDPNGELEKIEG